MLAVTPERKVKLARRNSVQNDFIKKHLKEIIIYTVIPVTGHGGL
jgi:hypothetical protein